MEKNTLILCMCARTHTGVFWDQKRISDPLELEFQAVVNHQVSAEDQIEVLQRAVLNCWAISGSDSSFLLFMVVIFCKVTENIELINELLEEEKV